MPFRDECADLLDETRHFRGTPRLAFHNEVVTLSGHTHIELRLEVAKVFVIRPEERFDRFSGNGDLPRLNGWDSGISLSYSDLTI